MNLYRFPQRHLHWSHLRTTSTSVRSSLDEQSKWSEAQRVGLSQREALLTACPEGPSRAASFRFTTIPVTPVTSQRTLSRVYASCGTETARVCARCVIGLDGRWLRPIPPRGRLNAADVVRMQRMRPKWERLTLGRSEERRVGKEWRSGRSQDQ